MEIIVECNGMIFLPKQCSVLSIKEKEMKQRINFIFKYVFPPLSWFDFSTLLFLLISSLPNYPLTNLNNKYQRI